jgi:hypothetical protein
MMFQIYALLSPRSAHQLIWNRFVKTKKGSGGNISLDLNLEFLNRVVKEAIKKLGPNASKRSIDRICHSMSVTTYFVSQIQPTSRLCILHNSDRIVLTFSQVPFDVKVP